MKIQEHSQEPWALASLELFLRLFCLFCGKAIMKVSAILHRKCISLCIVKFIRNALIFYSKFCLQTCSGLAAFSSFSNRSNAICNFSFLSFHGNKLTAPNAIPAKPSNNMRVYAPEIMLHPRFAYMREENWWKHTRQCDSEPTLAENESHASTIIIFCTTNNIFIFSIFILLN